MKITVISVGQIKEKFFKDGIAEYKKRLSRFCVFDEIVLNDEPIKDNASALEILKIKDIEGKKIINAIPNNSFVIALDLKGQMLDSVELSNKLSTIMTYNSSHIVFIIGGSLGLINEVISKADFSLSFSKMTYPHQLMKLILCEQIYRAFKIINNESYHK